MYSCITETLNDSFPSRLLKCAAHSDVPLRNPKGGIVNVALQDPAGFFFGSYTGYFSSKATKSWVVSSLLGETTYYSTGKQICLTPSAHGWHRFVAIVAQVFG